MTKERLHDLDPSSLHARRRIPGPFRCLGTNQIGYSTNKMKQKQHPYTFLSVSLSLSIYIFIHLLWSIHCSVEYADHLISW